MTRGFNGSLLLNIWHFLQNVGEGLKARPQPPFSAAPSKLLLWAASSFQEFSIQNVPSTQMHSNFGYAQMYLNT